MRTSRGNTEFGRHLRELREARGFSLVDVERLSHDHAEKIDKGTLSRYENGLQRVPASRLVVLGRIYGADFDELMAVLERARDECS